MGIGYPQIAFDESKGAVVDLSYTDLIERLYDLERLAEPPMPGEQGGCSSSYDRRSRYNAADHTYQDWDANDDGSGFIRHEDDWMVVFERTGPGVIWRVWSALPASGHVQIFIDESATPVVDMPFRDFFERFMSEIPPLNFPALAPTLSRGRNRFIPIPYNHSCKIRFAPGWGAYYHITHTTFPQGTTLPHVSGSFDRAACLALAQADRILTQRGWRHAQHANETSERITVTIPAGMTLPIHTLYGNRAICGLHVALDQPEPADAQQLLRELALSIHWDGETQPSVWSPLGDFFGSAPGVNQYRALPLGVTDGGFYSNWFMPFSSQASLSMANDGLIPRTLTFTIRHRPLERSADQLLRFHAKWHRDAFLEQAQAERRSIDWPLLLVEGQGRFCGIHLHVWNTWPEPAELAESWWYGRWDRKSIDWWWGEGDEKFFVDGERFPSTFGTGSEDYIGYAWAAEPPFPTFESAYACQPFVALNGNGHTSVSRFHICDDVPFQTSFAGYIEKYKGNQWGQGGQCLYAAVAYWYQQAGSSDRYPTAPVAERVGYDSTP